MYITDTCPFCTANQVEDQKHLFTCTFRHERATEDILLINDILRETQGIHSHNIQELLIEWFQRRATTTQGTNQQRPALQKELLDTPIDLILMGVVPTPLIELAT